MGVHDFPAVDVQRPPAPPLSLSHSLQLTDKHGLISSLAKKNHVLQEYRSLVRVTLPVWAMYPVLWAVGDGSRTIHWEIKELVYVFVRTPLPSPRQPPAQSLSKRPVPEP